MKKNLKGFTLIEVIVALAVFSIMTLLLATMFTAACAIRLDTNATNKQVDKQAVSYDAGPSPAPGDGLSLGDDIIFNDINGTAGAVTVDIDVYEMEKSAGNKSPNIKYFTVAP